MSKFISPFYDWSFKHIFGSEEVKIILIDFLNSLFEGQYVITDVKFSDKEMTPRSKEERAIIFDIHCTTDKGDYIIVEMQNCPQTYFKDRALYYMSRSVVNQGEKGEGWEYKLKAVYGVFFLNYKMAEQTNRKEGYSLSEVMLIERESGEVFNPNFKQFFIELPRFTKTEKECVTKYDKWIYILKNLDTMETMPFAEDRNAAFAKLAERAAQANMTPEERADYEESLKNYRDYYNTIDSAVERGHAQGLAQGLAEGLAQGLAQGVDKNQRMIIFNMNADGVSVSLICKYTGLSEEEVLRIIESQS